MTSNAMPQFPEPYWLQSVDLPTFPKLEGDLDVEVAVIGGGMTGITSAYLLAKEGKKVALIEAGRVLTGTTGHTTAKVTAQHGIIYDELISHFGKEKTQAYYQANNEALQFIKNLVKEQQIDCDFSEQDAYIYTNSDQEMQKLISEYDAYEKLGIKDIGYLKSIEIPVEHKAAIVMRNQAQFHPLKYLKHLVEEFTKMGGQIYENTTAVDIEEGDEPRITTRSGHKVGCQHMIVSTHYPFYDVKGFYFSRMTISRSYALAVKTEKEFPGGMYINAETPSRSLRYTDWNGEKIVIFGGHEHQTGKNVNDNTFEYYEALEAFANETFGIKEIPYRWSAQDPTTLDKIPFVGRYSPTISNIFVATGYRKWGMTNSTNAARLMTDLIIGRENPYEGVFDPNRFNADPDVKKFLSINASVAKELIKGKLEQPSTQPETLKKNEGAPIMLNGQRAGAYRDENGQLHIVDTTCTHMGCELKWNNGERSWDCPCHGSRFSYKGEVLDGPAEIPLKRLSEEA
ncbi:FAD-dependent oxidoreductase [Mesobacillus maritimus]|uniref:FAD-dependent oxidoreductase n=1 Tax=Mesobacillus maritimus TaxID=1643336 RepID=UPI00204268C9|nr:FAD-dependent oxidoreductase [Mesobacillus maritimus]MCM3588213.1 FAD-dependent oxidoreductase [Mesobacillus maritimus]MCM3668853.1 FAD-dependent oxidoreductase [Mesobacillus maritimus]